MPNTDSRPVVVAVRHPDAANEFHTFPGDGLPVILDVDLGSSFNGVCEDSEQYAEWLSDMSETFRASGLTDDHPAHATYMEAVESADPGSD